MSRRAFTIFGAFAAIFAVVIPYFVITGTGDTSASLKPIASSDRNAQHLFQENCGTCHTLAAGGTDGIVGPNLDFRLAGGAPSSQMTVDGNCTVVLNAITNGLNGRMPIGILTGENATAVASFVARNVNYLGVQAAPPPSAASTTGSGSAGGSSGSASTATGPITASSTACKLGPSGATTTGSAAPASSSGGGSAAG